VERPDVGEKPPKLTPGEATRLFDRALQTAGAKRSSLATDRARARVGEFSAAAVEVMGRMALQDPTMGSKERLAALGKLVDHSIAMDHVMIRGVQAGVVDRGAAGEDGVPKSEEETAAMEAEADRLQKARMEGYGARKKAAEEARAKAKAAAMGGEAPPMP
jgi:hypothetical protein